MPEVDLNQVLRIREKANHEATARYGDGLLVRNPTGDLVLNSMTGADVTCSIVMPKPEGWKDYLNARGLKEEDYDLPVLKVWAELETISVSSARSVSAVRRLGEHHAHEYTRGGRTVGGSLVFTTFNRDVFADFYRMHPGESFWGQDKSPPFFVDQIPPFHILISGATEYGAVAQAALINVHLTNFGTTMSIHDLKQESTYTYVAQFFFPWVQDTYDFQNLVKLGTALDVAPRLSNHPSVRNEEKLAEVLQGLSPEERRIFNRMLRSY